MSNLGYGCTCRSNCISLGVLASIVVGIITAFLTFSAVITVGTAFLWVALGIAVVYLAIIFAGSVFFRFTSIKTCVCSILGVLLTGILGTILTSLILLAVTFAATSVIGAIITGLLLLFFSLIITSVVCFVKCNADCNDNNCQL